MSTVIEQRRAALANIAAFQAAMNSQGEHAITIIKRPRRTTKIACRCGWRTIITGISANNRHSLARGMAIRAAVVDHIAAMGENHGQKES